MISVLDEAQVQTSEANTPSGTFKVNDRVIWTALRNSPKHYMPGEKLCGTIIDAFDNAGTPTYRIRLDMAWNEHVLGQTIGEQIVIGNVRGGTLRLIIG